VGWDLRKVMLGWGVGHAENSDGFTFKIYLGGTGTRVAFLHGVRFCRTALLKPRLELNWTKYVTFDFEIF
jgi:hypothetical protein